MIDIAKKDIKVHVDVQNKHIKDGERKNCSRCPIALALRDVITDRGYFIEYLGVGAGSIVIDLNENEYRAEVPGSALQFINAFDKQESVDPFSFDLELVFRDR